MPKVRIMIVEDEGLVARDVELMLEGLGYEVVASVSSGEEALALAREAKPDLALIDIVIKGMMDGIQTSRDLWERFKVPVVYVTAYADETIIKRAKLTEPFGYILKPFDERELRIAIEIALYKAEMETKLRDREERLSTLLQNVKEGVIATDGGGRVTFMNPHAETLIGWTQTEAQSLNLETILRPAEAPTGDMVQIEEVTLFHKSGTSFSAELQQTPFRSGNDARGSVIVFRDISARKRSDAALSQSWAKLKQALEGAIRAIATTIEIKDQYTAGHQRRVSKLSCAIAREMGLPESQAEGIRVAGDIHDIGKIYVPTEILSKPGRLSAMEFAIIRTHPQLGFDILHKIEFPWPVAQIVLQHHERMDGTGYPGGLAKNAILIEARIIGVSDTVEAMSSNRPYRPALTIDDALDEISRNKGSHYDADVVDFCLKLFREKDFTIHQDVE